MTTCWKCGKPVPDCQTECEDGCDGGSGADKEKAMLDFVAQNFLPLDLDKIKTVEDLTLVLKCFWPHVGVLRGSAEHQVLKKFLRTP